MAIRAEDLIVNKLSLRRLGARAPIWHVSKVLADGTLWAWSPGRGWRHIQRPENYQVVAENRIVLEAD